MEICRYTLNGNVCIVYYSDEYPHYTITNDNGTLISAKDSSDLAEVFLDMIYDKKIED